MLHDVVLRGRHVTLEPLRVEQATELAEAIRDGDDVYRWTNTSPRGEVEMRQWILDRQADRPAGRAMPFLQRDPETGHAMGSTSIFDWNEKERCAEIGHTWLAAPYRRTGANTEAKLLLLTHAFETLHLERVQIVTDARNQRSRDAIERIGAHFEGILRRHRRGFDGELRDSAYYSFVASEWTQKRPLLAAKLRASPLVS